MDGGWDSHALYLPRGGLQEVIWSIELSRLTSGEQDVWVGHRATQHSRSGDSIQENVHVGEITILLIALREDTSFEYRKVIAPSPACLRP